MGAVRAVDGRRLSDEKRRLRSWCLLVLCALLLASCSTASTVASRAPAAPAANDRDEPPASAKEYASAAQPNGVVGGSRAARLAKEISGALIARGDEAQSDGALVAVAVWLVRQSAAPGSRQRGAGEAALRAGFVGSVLSAATLLLDEGDQDVWRRALADLASNMPVTRYGVYVSPDGIAAVVFGRMEVSLDPFPRHLRAGEVCRLRGEVAARYDHARVYLTRPDGKIDETRLPGRKVDVSLPVTAPGIYRVEVMSDGATGPVVLANVPVYVGVSEPAWAPAPASPRDGVSPLGRVEAEARVLALLNGVRREAGLGPLASDPELGAVARAHTEDMIAQRFFGHVSPSTGKFDNRLQRAGLVVSASGENVAQADTADDVHRVLMESPAHRANMLGAKFTHVGIAVGFRSGEAGDLLTTMVFARRPPPPSTPVTPALVTTFVSSLRRARGVDPIAADPVLQAAAQAGLTAFTNGGAASPDQAIAVAHDALVRESRRLRRGHRAICIELIQVLELDELEQDPLFAQPRLGKVGLAVATKEIGNAVKILVFVLAEGAACR